MNNNLTVSVILPVFNVEAYIQCCVQSIFDQDYPNIELIAVDDCGTDNSIKIVEEMFSSHPSHVDCKLLHHEKNRGLSAARNTGVNDAYGDYLLFVDSDDYLLPHAISHLVTKAQETNAEVVVCDFKSDAGNSNVGWHQRSDIEMLNSNAACIKGFAQQWITATAWCKLVNRNFVVSNKLYFKEGIINEDSPWTFQLCLHTERIAFLNEPLYFYRFNEKSIMSSAKKQRVVESNETALIMHYDEILKRPQLWENEDIYLIYMRQIAIYFKLVYLHCSFREYLKRIRLLKKLRYNSSWFRSSKQPVSYKVLSKMISMPYLLAGLLTYVMISIQQK